MPPIYPSTALKSHQREIKEQADVQLVYITENGRGKYVFVSEEVFEKTVHDAVEQALYEERMARALGESRKDYSEGHVYASREELMEGVAQRRAARG